MYPSKNNWNNWNWNAKQYYYSSKKLKINEIRHFKSDCTRYADLGNGTKSIKFLLSKASKDMHEPVVPMLFPLLAHTLVLRNFSTPTSLGRSRRA